MNKKQRIEEVRRAIKETADTLKIHPTDVRTSDILSAVDYVTNWDIRMVGGLAGIKKSFPILDRDLAAIRETKNINQYINELEKKLGQKDYIEKEILRIVDEKIEPVKIQSYKGKPTKRSKQKRELVCMLNDMHYGLTVKSEEVGGVNQYGWTEASRRTAFFINEVCNYKIEKRDETDTVHLIVNGDVISGVIHNLTGRDNDLLAHQINGAIYILTNAVARLSENFRQVKVYTTVGNHGNMPHRREGSGRVLSQVYDSYESVAYFALSAAFRNTPNVSFQMGHSLYETIDLPAGRLLFAHGDLLFSKQLGNPGTVVNAKALGDAVMRFNNGEKAKGNQPASVVLLGHTHAHFHITTQDGTQIYNPPSLSGVDSYAFHLGINHNLVAQLMFESTDKYIFGDSRLVRVQEADSMTELDKLIPIYNRELKWS